MERAIKRNRRQCGAKRRLCMLLSCLWPQRLQMVRMTAALIALCAVSWLLLSLRDRSRIKRLELDLSDATIALDTTRARLLAITVRDAALIAEAYALLHDTAARAKDGRRKPWAEARQKWAEKAGKA